MNNVMDKLWEKIAEAQTKGASHIQTEHEGTPVQVNVQKTGWYEGYY